LDEEKPKCAGLAQENGFGTAKCAMAGEMHCNGKHHGKKSVINMM
jgi:hypothetical protein